MQFVVGQHRTEPTITGGQTGAIMNTSRGISPDQISSEMAIPRGEDMLRTVVKTCGLANTDAKLLISELFFPRDPESLKAARFEKAASSLERGLKGEAAKGSDVIDVRYGMVGDPQTPACVLQNLGQLYLQKRLQLERPPASSQSLADRTTTYPN